MTTPIYYVNDVPHIGHAYTTVIADALARWHRLMGEEVMFLTGTDEHGLKVERSAEEAGRTAQQQADLHSERFRAAWDLLDISYDDYIRTTEPRHHVAVQALLTKIKEEGHIYVDTYAGHYCVGCEAYYNDDELGEDLACPIHKRPVEWLEEENWFFRLSAFADQLTEWLSNDTSVVPKGKRSEALGIVKQGLDDVSISRSSLTWGVKVPWDQDQVFYVWYDALINYATAVGYGLDDGRFNTWWPNVHHIVGKDILRFHCVYWPAMLMAAGLTPPQQVAVHGYLLVGGEKMSKTGLTQISPADLVGDFGVDGVRYQFLRGQSFGPDSDFSHEQMVTRYNSDLANSLGNLLSRVTTVVAKKCEGAGPAPRPDSPLAELSAEAVRIASQHWAEPNPPLALEAAINLVRDTNAFLEANEPWKMEPGDDLDAVMGDALETLRIVSVLVCPAIPESAADIWTRIGLPGRPDEATVPADLAWGGYPGGLEVAKGAPLFPRISA